MIKAAIFDMDGTVIDSTESDYLAWKKILEDYKIELSFREYLNVLGAKGSEIVNRYLDLDTSETRHLLDQKEEYFKSLVNEKGLRSIQGVESLLNEIKGLNVKTSLATGAGKEKLDFIFQKVNLRNYFDVVITADDTKVGKPDPEVFLTAAIKLNTLPSDCVVFEDAKNGVKAAKNGGMKCVAIVTTHHPNELQEADLIIKSYSEFDFRKFYSGEKIY
jgi:beta-phosphoglucomutase family hydrolase